MIITKFICTKNTCPNFDIVYPMLEADETAMCGGCKNVLEGVTVDE